MYKQTFELMLKSMKDYIDSTKRLYDAIPDKKMFKYSYDEIMEYEVVVKEYSKYDRDTLNQIIMKHIEEDCSELEDLYDDFSDEVNDYVDELHIDEDEEEEFWNDPVLVYEAMKRNQNVMDSLFKQDDKEKKQSRKSRNERKTLPREDSHVRSIDDFVEDKNVKLFDEIN